MRLYETAFLIAPNISDEEIEQLIQQMAEIISEKKGKMHNIDKWGKRKLAYPIKRFDSAFYTFFLYEGTADIPSELERRFKQSEGIIRFLTISRDPKDEPKPKDKKAAAKKQSQEEIAPEVKKKPSATKEVTQEVPLEAPLEVPLETPLEITQEAPKSEGKELPSPQKEEEKKEE